MTAKILIFFVQVLARLPLAVSRSIGSFLARIAIVLKTRGYLVTQRNLEIAYPELAESERVTLAQESLRQSAQMALETAAVWFRDDAWRASKKISIEGQPLFEQARSEGRGVILILPHFGNWEMAGIHFARQMTSTAMYAPPKLKALNPLMRHGRSSADLVPTSTRGVMKILKALREGNMTVILPDQVPVAEEAGIFVPFFNRPAFTMTLIYKLMRKSNPVVLVAYGIRRKGGFDVGCMEPDQDIYSDNEQTAVAAMNASIEKLVAMAPAQYQWEYKRYKKQPPAPEGQPAYDDIAK